MSYRRVLEMVASVVNKEAEALEALKAEANNKSKGEGYAQYILDVLSKEYLSSKEDIIAFKVQDAIMEWSEQLVYTKSEPSLPGTEDLKKWETLAWLGKWHNFDVVAAAVNHVYPHPEAHRECAKVAWAWAWAFSSLNKGVRSAYKENLLADWLPNSTPRPLVEGFLLAIKWEWLPQPSDWESFLIDFCRTFNQNLILPINPLKRLPGTPHPLVGGDERQVNQAVRCRVD